MTKDMPMNGTFGKRDEKLLLEPEQGRSCKMQSIDDCFDSSTDRADRRGQHRFASKIGKCAGDSFHACAA